MELFIVLCVIAVVVADFKDYQKRHDKVYETAQDALNAEAHFHKHQKFIDEHNEKFKKGESTFSVGHNVFTDENNKELVEQSFHHFPIIDLNSIQEQARNTFPHGADFKNYTSWMQPIVNQKSCSGCWAFATIAQLESLYKRNSYDYIMSPQYLIDCSNRIENKGCAGGRPDLAMETIFSTGIPLEKDYPFTATQADACKFPLPPFITPNLPTEVNVYYLANNETLLKNIVSQEGPVVVSIYENSVFEKYSSGIFYNDESPTNCTKINHSIVVVGYGSDGPGLDFWLIRNSFGTSWGMAGYAKMARNRNSNSNIACFAFYMK